MSRSNIILSFGLSLQDKKTLAALYCRQNLLRNIVTVRVSAKSKTKLATQVSVPKCHQ